MKLLNKIAIVCSAVLTFAGCQQYELNTDFTVPTALVSPEAVVLDVTSSVPVVLSWEGGSAADGGVVLYEVLFDKESGDFSNPLAAMKSDLGASPKLTITHAGLNGIARSAGITPNETGNIKWTVTASKGGEVRPSGIEKVLTLTRGDVVDNIPENLYLYGTATENNGQGGLAFRRVEEGKFVIYTTFKDGKVNFKSSTSADAYVYFAADGILKEGEGTIDMTATASDKVIRMTVDYNSMSVTTDEIGKDVRCIWGATYADIAVCRYAGDGKFVGEGNIVFYGPGVPGTPDWCSWIEERYYFIAKVNGVETCWGRHDSVSAERPVGGEPASFYALYEYPWSQWDHLWKMSGDLDKKHATITIDTNADGLMVHTFTDIKEMTDDVPDVPEPNPEVPSELYLYGTATENDGQGGIPFRKTEDGKFIIYTTFKDGKVNFKSSTSADASVYYAENGALKAGAGETNMAATASDKVIRITVDYNAMTVTTDEIDKDVRCIWGLTFEDIAVCSYAGNGRFTGEGDIVFYGPDRPDRYNGWVEERYYFIAKVNGVETCWGRHDTVSDQRPSDNEPASFYALYEYSWSQWEHLWKMSESLDNKSASITIDTNADGLMIHTFSNIRNIGEEVEAVPTELYLYGSATENDGQGGIPFRKVEDGRFVVYTTFKDGKVNFKSSTSADASVSYAEGGVLKRGAGEMDVTATASDKVVRMTVDYNTMSVTTDEIGREVRCIWSATFSDIAVCSYAGNGRFVGEGDIVFYGPGRPGTPSWCSWPEERYYFIAKVNGTDKCWGRHDSVSAERPVGGEPASFYGLHEFDFSFDDPGTYQWLHCWKMNGDLDNRHATITIDTNADNLMIHTFTNVN